MPVLTVDWHETGSVETSEAQLPLTVAATTSVRTLLAL